MARLRLFALRDDDKPCDARGFKEDLAIQLDLHPPHAKTPKACAVGLIVVYHLMLDKLRTNVTASSVKVGAQSLSALARVTVTRRSP